MAPTIKTVLGEIDPSELGRTLTHEHLSLKFDISLYSPDLKIDSQDFLPWTLENIGEIRQFPYTHTDNVILNDASSEAAILKSLQLFKAAGGGAVVENSSFGLHRRTAFLKEASLKSGVHIVAGTGYYLGPFITEAASSLSVEEMAEMMSSEILVGFKDDPTTKAGFIGEVGCSYPIQDIEKKSIQASAAVQSELNCPVSFHCEKHPEEIVRIFLEAGGRADKTIMSHCQKAIGSPDLLVEFADLGTYCQLDTFGMETSYFQFDLNSEMQSDSNMISMVKALIAAGREDKILLSHDIHSKHRLEDFGGHGLKHLLKATIPKMLVKGVTQEQIDKMFKSNPALVLAF